MWQRGQLGNRLAFFLRLWGNGAESITAECVVDAFRQRCCWPSAGKLAGGFLITTGAHNVAIGNNASAGGTQNTAIGHGAGVITAGAHNAAIGYLCLAGCLKVGGTGCVHPCNCCII